MAEITLEDVWVEFPIYTARMQSIRYMLLNDGVGGMIGRDRKKRPVIEALRGINLKISNGERIGLIGRNGAGKTTLLKVLSGVCFPSAGEHNYTGKISSLINVGSFMDPEVSGYENIYFMGMMIGFSKTEIDAMIPDIEDFTELGEYLHMPVRTYSSGMMVRLSFSMITSIEPDILILDEALGAGDAHFVDKALARAERLYDQANIIVMASHSPAMIEKMCDRVILLDKGQIIYDGEIHEAYRIYHELGSNTESPAIFS